MYCDHMPNPKQNRSINISEEVEALFRQAMEVEYVEGLSTWVRRAAVLHAQNVLGREDQMSELIDAVKDLAHRMERVEFALKDLTQDNGSNMNRDDTVKLSTTGSFRHRAPSQ